MYLDDSSSKCKNFSLIPKTLCDLLDLAADITVLTSSNVCILEYFAHFSIRAKSPSDAEKLWPDIRNMCPTLTQIIIEATRNMYKTESSFFFLTVRHSSCHSI